MPSPQLNLAKLWTSNPMGQQRYESEIERALRDVVGDEWRIVVRTFGGGRSEAEVRAPTRLMDRLPFLAPLIGRRVQSGAVLTHRLDLRIPAGPGPEVVTVHDLPPLRFHDEGQMPPWAIRPLRGPVICPSQFAAQEVCDLLGARDITVIPYGLSEAFREGSRMPSAQLQELYVRPPFIVFAAGSTRRKNLAGLAIAWRIVNASRPESQLVMCGPSNKERTRIFAGVENVVAVGYQEPLAIASLMRSSAGVVVPSIYEGFGLPALEGMACGVPVVAANCGALPEVCGDAALLCEPDPNALAEGLIAVLDNDTTIRDLALRGRDRAVGFEWAEAARQHAMVYRRAS